MSEGNAKRHTIRRSGARFIALCDPDERLVLSHGRIIITNHAKPPDFLNTDGSREPVIMVQHATVD